MFIQDLISKHYTVSKHRIAIVEGNSHITYGQLEILVNDFASTLLFEGVQPQDVVCLLCSRSIEYIIAVLAIIKVRAVFSPIDPEYPEERKKYIIENSNSDYLICNEFNNSLNIPEIENIKCISFNNKHNSRKDFGLINYSENDIIYVLFTSGSTGKPKGVLIENRNLFNYLDWARKYYIQEKNLKIAFFTSIAFDLTITSIFLPLITGNSIEIFKDSNQEILVKKIITDNCVDIIKLTPSHLKILINSKYINQYAYMALKCFIVGGERLEHHTAEKVYNVFKRNIKIYNEYGPTEATIGCMIYEFDPSMKGKVSVPIGKAIDNCKIYLLDENLSAVKQNQRGEIYIAGKCLSPGYLSDPKSTQLKFQNDPFNKGGIMYKSGDFATLLSDNNIEYVGRVDNQVKFYGHRIELDEISTNLCQHTNINQAVVLLRNVNSNKFLIAYYISNNKQEIKDKELKNFLSQRLPEYMIPSKYIQIESIPLTINGKLDSNLLPTIDTKQSATIDNKNITESLIDIWANVLNVEINNISLNTSFFDLGGHSLKAILLINEIVRIFKVRLTLSDIFKASTIERQINLISRSSKKTQEHTTSDMGNYYPISFEQHPLLLHNKLLPNSVAYNQFYILEIKGNTDFNRLEYTFNQLIKKHSVLRTTIKMINGEPMNVVNDINTFKIEEIHIESEENINEAIEQFSKPFDLTQAPIIRIGYIELKRNKSILLFDSHHILIDGYSFKLLINDFKEVYLGYEQNVNQIQYKQYVDWQNSPETKALYSKQQTFWLNILKRDFTNLKLPYDFKNDNKKHDAGKIIKSSINNWTFKKIKEISMENELTTFMIILSLYCLFLSKVANQKTIVIGTGISGRNNALFNEVMGMFVKELPLIIDIDNKLSIIDFFMHVKKYIIDVFDNSDIPMQYLVKTQKINLPKVQAAFVHQNLEILNENTIKIDDNLALESIDITKQITKYDLLLTSMEQNNEINLWFEYDVKLFTEQTITNLSDSFIHFCENTLKNIDITVEKTAINLIDHEIEGLSDFSFLEDSLSDEFNF